MQPPAGLLGGFLARAPGFLRCEPHDYGLSVRPPPRAGRRVFGRVPGAAPALPTPTDHMFEASAAARRAWPSVRDLVDRLLLLRG